MSGPLQPAPNREKLSEQGCLPSLQNGVAMASLGLAHVELTVRDLQRSLPFYRDLLGPDTGGDGRLGSAWAMMVSPQCEYTHDILIRSNRYGDIPIVHNLQYAPRRRGPGDCWAA